MMDIDQPAPIRKLSFDSFVTDTPTKKRPRAPPSNASQPTNIEVYLRIRPTDPARSYSAKYSITNENQSIRLTAPNKADTRSYSFNHVFDQTTTNAQVFEQIGRQAIDRFIGGYTNLLFAYGITGSGKTHTITGSGNHIDGLLPSILRNLFNHQLIRNSNKYTLFATYLENYTKELYDLLRSDDQRNNKENMNVRNNHQYNTNKRSNNTNKVSLRVLNDGVDILDATTLQIESAQEAIALITAGNARRSKANTKQNRNSSRSHALFILDLFEGDQARSRLCLVDLAGSESAKRNGFTMNDIGFNEACEINASLSVLGRCIEAIENKSKAPWREATLTRLLWNYLHGKGYVTMIVNAHICNEDYNETMRALEFAAKTQNIEMNPVVNSVRPSTRHKTRICKTPKRATENRTINATPSRNTSREGSIDINFINSCNIDQLRKIAAESYKTALRSRDMVKKLRSDKIEMIDKILKNGLKNKAKMKGIQEENAMDVDQEEDLVDKCNKEWETKYNQKENALKSKNAEYDALCKEMAENMMNFEEKNVKHKSEMNALNELHSNQLMQQNMKMQEMESKYNQEINNVKVALQLDMKDLEHDLKNKVNKIKQLENTVDGLQVTKINLEADLNATRDAIEKLQKQQAEMQQKESQLEGFERNKEIEYRQKEQEWNERENELRSKQKQLLIENHKLEATAARYKSIIDESEQKIEKYAHLNREQKSKIQQQHISIMESGEKNKKLMDMMTGLKAEFKGKCEEFEKIKQKLHQELDQKCEEFEQIKQKLHQQLNQQKRINEGAQKEILSLHQAFVHKENELKENKNYKAEFEQLTQEFIQRGEELKNVKNVNNAMTKQLENQQLVYEKKINTLSKDIADTKQLFDDDLAGKSQVITQLNDQLKKLDVEHRQKMQRLLNECDTKCLSQDNVIAEKDEVIAQKIKTIEEIQCKFNAATQEKDALTEKMNENENWSEKYHKLFTTFTQHSDKNKILKAKYSKQREQFVKLKEELVELKQCKNDLMSNIKTVQDEMEKSVQEIRDQMISNQTEQLQNKCSELQKLQNEYKQYQESSEEIIENKEKQIDELHSKCVESDAIYQQLQAEYDILENKYSDATNSRDKVETDWIETNETMQNELDQKQKEIEIIQNELEEMHETLEMKENEYNELSDEITKQKEFHRIALKEADEEYLREQQESKELYELNTKLEDKNKAIVEELERMNKETQRLKQEIAAMKEHEKKLTHRHSEELNELQQKLKKQIENQFAQRFQVRLTEQTDSLQKEIKSLQEQIKHLQLQSQPSSRRVSAAMNSHSADGGRKNRKRSREQMESPSNNNMDSFPNKRRKITIDRNKVQMLNNSAEAAMEDEVVDDDNQDTSMIFEELEHNETIPCDVHQSDSISLQPQNLLNEYNKEDPAPMSPQSIQSIQSIEAVDTSNVTATDEKFVIVISDHEETEDDDDVEIIQSDDSHAEPKKAAEEETVNDDLPEIEISAIEIQMTPKKPKPKKNIITPALSHLSEGDTPLVKPSTSKIRKAISRHNKPKITYTKSTPDRNKRNSAKPKKYLAMRTPATKQRRRYTTQPFDVNQPTPTTKTALQKLRCVDLRKKLKKHNLKAQGNKDALIQTLFDHKNANKSDEETESEESEEVIDSKWIGKCIKTTDGRKYYKGIRVNGVEYRLGSEVFVTNDTDHDWLAQVVELFEDEDGGCFMNNVWFWRHNEIARAIKSKPHSSWKPAADEVFLSNGHDLDQNHIGLINLDKQFKVFDSKKKMMQYRGNNESNEEIKTYFCKYIFNLKGHRLIPKDNLEDIEEGNENEIDSEINTNSKANSKRRKRKTTSSKCESPKNKKQRPRRRRRQKSIK